MIIRSENRATMDKQVQKGQGNLQVLGDLNVHPIDPEIIRTMLESTKNELRAEFSLGNQRALNQLNKLTTLILPKLTQDELKNAFTDPDFQMDVIDAHRSAIRTSSDEDLAILSDMLEQRAAISEPTPRHKMATRKAIEVVGQLSQGDLDSLTILWYGIYMSPQGGILSQNLTAMNIHLEPFVKSGLQDGNNWLADLDILDCLQLSSGLTKMKSFAQLFSENKYSQYFILGMDAETAATMRVKLESLRVGLGSLIIEHPIDKARFVLAGTDEAQFRGIMIANIKPMTRHRQAVIDEVVAANNYSGHIPDHISKSRDLFAGTPSTKAVSDWWGENKFNSLNITAVGIVLAYSNFHRKLPNVECPTLPELLG